MIITVSRSDGSTSYHGEPYWRFTLSDAHYVWEKAGAHLLKFEGRKSIECATTVRDAISGILMAPEDFISVCGYYDLRATVTALTELFFTLREIPDGIVHVS